jgi:hypothetical protein
MREITDGREVSEPGAFFAQTLAVTVGPRNSGPDHLKSGYEARLGLAGDSLRLEFTAPSPYWVVFGRPTDPVGPGIKNCLR